MENASKALIMAATILLGVLIIAFMVYMFNDAARLNLSQETIEKERLIQKFNADFLGVESEDTDIIESASGVWTVKEAARFVASSKLNKISDVISIVNDAHDINYTNNRHYQNNFIEYTNAMVIIVSLDKSVEKEFSGENENVHYVIFPHREIESGYLYRVTDSEFSTLMTEIEEHKREIDISSFEKVSCSQFMEFFRESRLAVSSDNPPDNRNYTLYKYYFSGKLNINETTGKVDRITFTVVEDKKY